MEVEDAPCLAVAISLLRSCLWTSSVRYVRLSSAPTDSKWKFKNLNGIASVNVIDSQSSYGTTINLPLLSHFVDFWTDSPTLDLAACKIQLHPWKVRKICLQFDFTVSTIFEPLTSITAPQEFLTVLA